MKKQVTVFFLSTILFIKAAQTTGIDDYSPQLDTKNHTVISYSLGQDIKFPFTLASGFSGGENSHRWTVGHSATIQVPLNNETHGQLHSISFVNTFAFLPENHVLNVTVKLNGHDTGQYIYDGINPSYTINVNFPQGITDPSELIFVMKDATSPSNWPSLNNPDQRILGIGFRDVALTFTTPSSATAEENEFQTFVSTKFPNLFEMWKKPETERIEYFIFLSKSEQEIVMLALRDLKDALQHESKLYTIALQSQLKSLNRTTEETLDTMNESSQTVQNAKQSKNECEKSIQHLLEEFETFVCSFAPPDCTADQLDQVKNACTPYLKETYRFLIIDAKTKLSQTTQQKDEQQAQKNTLLNSFLRKICKGFKLYEYTFRLNREWFIIEHFELFYFERIKKLEGALTEINPCEQSFKENETKFTETDQKIKILETPTYLLFKELQSIHKFM